MEKRLGLTLVSFLTQAKEREKERKEEREGERKRKRVKKCAVFDPLFYSGSPRISGMLGNPDTKKSFLISA
jgi:hypothetical protein